MADLSTATWQVIEDDSGYLNIHETDPDDPGGLGDIIATTYQDEAHANLIATAPEMLLALECVRGFANTLSLIEKRRDLAGQLHEIVNAAIAKATGAAQ